MKGTSREGLHRGRPPLKVVIWRGQARTLYYVVSEGEDWEVVATFHNLAEAREYAKRGGEPRNFAEVSSYIAHCEENAVPERDAIRSSRELPEHPQYWLGRADEPLMALHNALINALIASRFADRCPT